jgi:hypothetical protein
MMVTVELGGDLGRQIGMRSLGMAAALLSSSLLIGACAGDGTTEVASGGVSTSVDEDAAALDVALDPPPCTEVDTFAETYLDTGWESDRGPAAADPAEQVASAEAVVLGRLTGVDTFALEEREGASYGFEIDEVLAQSDGAPLAPGSIELQQDRAPADRALGGLEEQLPVHARVVAFMYHTDELPGDGWGPNLEGLWIECLDESGTLALGGDIVEGGGWAGITDLDTLVEAVRPTTLQSTTTPPLVTETAPATAPSNPLPTTTQEVVSPTTVGVTPPAPELVVGREYYVDVDLECQAFELAGFWVLDSGDPSTWQNGERFEGGMFTPDAPDHGTFVGDAEGVKTATFRRLPLDELPECTPLPRP